MIHNNLIVNVTKSIPMTDFVNKVTISIVIRDIVYFHDIKTYICISSLYLASTSPYLIM